MKDYSHVRALVDIKDDEGVYCRKGEVYEIIFIDEVGEVYHIECEQNRDGEALLSLTAIVDDPDFEFLMLEEDEDES